MLTLKSMFKMDLAHFVYFNDDLFLSVLYNERFQINYIRVVLMKGAASVTTLYGKIIFKHTYSTFSFTYLTIYHPQISDSNYFNFVKLLVFFS